MPREGELKRDPCVNVLPALLVSLFWLQRGSMILLVFFYVGGYHVRKSHWPCSCTVFPDFRISWSSLSQVVNVEDYGGALC